jgi:hypothetical protein
VAERMSWAAHQSTSRKEDMAYCLLGIFYMNMPMLYGEGEKAFIRLQEGITKTSDDMSIFSWCNPQTNFSSYRGLLARSVSDFIPCNNFEWSSTKRNPVYKLPTEESIWGPS